ncbi:extracellular solute-binding protein [Streptomyces sp. MBT62]|nr:extracellular solute-binding protein [Streptomyces sp. MBT62]MBK6015079.1 extracellular solute-binding protein [Streptomyces sp. MBT53]
MIAAMSVLGMTAVLGGCGLGGDSGEVTLRLVAADYGDSASNSSRKYWDALVKAYEAKHPGVKVDVGVYSWNEVDAKVRAMVDAGKAPDMAQIGAYADYADEGRLYSTADLLSIPVEADFLEPLADAGEVDHVQYGIPFAASTRVLFYNKTLFAQAGLTPPRNWSELAADAEALKERGVKYPFALPLGSEEAQAETMQWLLGGGGGYTDDLGSSYTLDSAENISTFTWLRDNLVAKGLTGPVAPAKLNRADAFAAFANGDVGMLNGHPTLIQQAAKKGVKFGTVAMPGRTGKAKTTMGVADWMTAFKQNGHRDQIGDFLDYVYSEKNVLAFSREYDLLPVTNSASKVMEASKQDQDLRPFLEELPLSTLYPVGNTSWATVSADIKKRIGQAVAANGSPGAVLGQLQAAASLAESGK